MRTPAYKIVLPLLFGLTVLEAHVLADDVERRTLNDGQLVLEDIPEIPDSLVQALNRYQHVRGAGFRDWTFNGQSIFLSTRFAEVRQLHRIDQPGGARHQLTFFPEPFGSLRRSPRDDTLLYSMDAGGNENAQLFLFDLKQGEPKLLTDGKSKNGAALWHPKRNWIAYQSTQRNGRSNDVWLNDLDASNSSRLLLESPDGTWWGPLDWDAAGNRLLIQQYVSVNDSRIHALDVKTGALTLIAGSSETPSRNLGSGTATWTADEAGIYFVTDQQGEFAQLAELHLQDEKLELITHDIPWDVEDFELSDDRQRGAFSVNEEGRSRLFLFDPQSNHHKVVESIPTGLVGSMGFSPDGKRLALTLNTSQTTMDVYVLQLGDGPLDFGDLKRWTYSEVGGLDTSQFSQPELVRYPTFDQVDGGPRTIPAFVYRPPGPGPHPVVIYIHGGPESQFQPGFVSTFQSWIDQLGVAVIAPNVRGSSGYGRSYVRLDNGRKREDSVRDIGALLDWIESQPNLDSQRVAVYGGSYGGYMVLASAVHYSDRLRAAIDVVGISNFVTFLENTEDYRRDLRRAEYGDERDPEMRTFLESISPLNHVDKIQIPLFVVQGQNDPRVPVSEARQMVQAVRTHGGKVWYMNALNEGHGYSKKENRDIFGQATVLFLKEHLIGE